MASRITSENLPEDIRQLMERFTQKVRIVEMLLRRGLLASTFHHTEESPFASADGNGNTDRKGWKDHYPIPLNQQWPDSRTWRAYGSKALDGVLREATWPQLIGGTQQEYSVIEPENDVAVQQRTHCLTPSKTDPLGFIHSDPTTLEMSSEAAKQTKMNVNTTSNHWGVRRVADYKVLRKHSGSKDKTPWQELRCQQVYLLDCRPDTQQTESKFRDAPWRKKDTSKIANKNRRRPPTPPSPPRKRTAVFSGGNHDSYDILTRRALAILQAKKLIQVNFSDIAKKHQ